MRPDAEPPSDKFGALLSLEPKFRKTWERARADQKDTSASGWDMALTDFAVLASWTDQEITNLLIAHRRKHGDDLKLRRDYYIGTIHKARIKLGTIDEILADVEEPEVRRETALTYVSQHIGIEVSGLLRRPGPPSSYRLHTERGDVALTSISDLTSYPKFRDRVADQTNHLMSPKAQLWPSVARALLEICEDDVIEDLTEQGRVKDWIEGYLADTRRIYESIEQAVSARHPFQNPGKIGGRLGFFGDKLHHWLVNQRLERITKREMGDLLRAYGCEQLTVGVVLNEKWTTRLIWAVELPLEKSPSTAISTD